MVIRIRKALLNAYQSICKRIFSHLVNLCALLLPLYNPLSSALKMTASFYFDVSAGECFLLMVIRTWKVLLIAYQSIPKYLQVHFSMPGQPMCIVVAIVQSLVICSQNDSLFYFDVSAGQKALFGAYQSVRERILYFDNG